MMWDGYDVLKEYHHKSQKILKSIYEKVGTSLEQETKPNNESKVNGGPIRSNSTITKLTMPLNASSS